MIIDTETGLPQLPDGQYWEVVKFTPSYYGQGWFELQLVKRGGLTKTKMVSHQNPILAFLGVKTEVTETHDKVLLSELVRTVHKAKNETDATFRAQQAGTSWYASTEDDGSWVIQDTDLTKANVLATATRIFESLAKKEQELENERLLVGTYPPRSIN